PKPVNASAPSRVSLVDKPNRAVDSGPHSPLAAGSTRSQSGTKLALVSAHVRLALFTCWFAGCQSCARLAPTSVTYRPSVAFTAVLPLPNRSYAAPSRGLRSV